MEENQQSKEIEIDLREVFAELWSHALIIVLAAAVVGIAVFLFTSLLVTPEYTSETRVFILNRTDQNSGIINTQDLNTSTYLTQDILQLVTCRPVLENVITNLSLDMTTKQLESEISVSNPSDTRFIVIRVEDMDPYQAQAIADAVRIAAAEQITEIMDIEAVNADLQVESEHHAGHYARVYCRRVDRDDRHCSELYVQRYDQDIRGY